MKLRIIKINFHIFLTFYLTTFGMDAYSKYQVKFSAGTDTPGSSTSANARGITAGTTVKIFLQSGDMLRWTSSFAYSIATSYSQGEFGLGGSFYPLNSISKSMVQPFLYADGFLGLGRFKNTSSEELTRMDAGYNLGAGIDIDLFKKFGLNFIIESHSGGEKSLRMLIGFFMKN
jgi:hypothetical protein